MSHSSRESNLEQLREALAQANSEFFLILAERRKICVKVQEFKDPRSGYSHYDPERERVVFARFQNEMKSISLRELLAFSLIMEDQAQAFAPGSYPSWSIKTHLKVAGYEVFEMINPMILKLTHPEIFSRLKLSSEFEFLKQF
jgi:chorismate mutase